MIWVMEVRINNDLTTINMHRCNYFMCFLGVAVILFSCSKSESVNTIEKKAESDIVKTVLFVAPNFKDVNDVLTKTQLNTDGVFSWSENDTVGIYPNTGSQVFFVIDGSGASTSAQFDGGGWEFKQSSTYYSYYPFIGNFYLRREHIPVSYLGQKQIGTTSTSHIGPFSFMYTDATSAASGNLSFNYHHLGAMIYVKATLPAGTYTKMAITAPSNAFITKGYFNLLASSPSIIATDYGNQMIIDLEDINLTEQAQFTVYMMCAPVNLNGVEVTVSVLNSQKKEYQCKKTPSKEYVAGMKYGLNCTSFTEVPQSMGLIVGDWDDGGTIGGDAE